MTVIDEYLEKLDPDKRKELERIREIALQVVPDAVEKIGYGMPTLTYKGKPFLGFDVHTHHIGIYPYSGEVVSKIAHRLKDYGFSSGAIRVPYDKPIPESLLSEIIHLRLTMIG